MRYLLDTCVISELVQKEPDQKVIQYMRTLDEENTQIRKNVKASYYLSLTQTTYCLRGRVDEYCSVEEIVIR